MPRAVNESKSHAHLSIREDLTAADKTHVEEERERRAHEKHTNHNAKNTMIIN